MTAYPATLTTYMTDDGMELTAVIADENSAIMILRRDGTLIGQVTAFDYKNGKGCIDVLLLDLTVEGHAIVFAPRGGTVKGEFRVEQNNARVDVERDGARLFAVAFGPKGKVV